VTEINSLHSFHHFEIYYDNGACSVSFGCEILAHCFHSRRGLLLENLRFGSDRYTEAQARRTRTLIS
jgi:hypothetical protein